eukprot:645703-Alexandrium_andersonii.AAC.1
MDFCCQKGLYKRSLSIKKTRSTVHSFGPGRSLHQRTLPPSRIARRRAARPATRTLRAMATRTLRRALRRFPRWKTTSSMRTTLSSPAGPRARANAADFKLRPNKMP